MMNLTVVRSALLIGVITFTAVLTGCTSINSNFLLDKGTKVEIINATEGAIYSAGVAKNEETVELMIKRIIGLTRDELATRNIEAFTTPTPGAAKLKYDIRTMNAGYTVIGSAYGVLGRDKYEVKYRVTFENPEGNIIFVDSEEKDDSDIDHIFDRIASRTARFVASSFKE